jgi:hypothetical protein
MHLATRTSALHLGVEYLARSNLRRFKLKLEGYVPVGVPAAVDIDRTPLYCEGVTGILTTEPFVLFFWLVYILLRFQKPREQLYGEKRISIVCEVSKELTPRHGYTHTGIMSC